MLEMVRSDAIRVGRYELGKSGERGNRGVLIGRRQVGEGGEQVRVGGVRPVTGRYHRLSTSIFICSATR